MKEVTIEVNELTVERRVELLATCRDTIRSIHNIAEVPDSIRVSTKELEQVDIALDDVYYKLRRVLSILNSSSETT